MHRYLLRILACGALAGVLGWPLAILRRIGAATRLSGPPAAPAVTPTAS